MKLETVKFMLMAQDMDRAVAFYRDVIGLSVRFASPHWSELTHGDAVVALHGGGTGEFVETGLSLEVEDADAACEEVAAGGGVVRNPAEQRANEPIRLARVTDPEGNGFAITQYVG